MIISFMANNYLMHVRFCAFVKFYYSIYSLWPKEILISRKCGRRSFTHSIMYRTSPSTHYTNCLLGPLKKAIKLETILTGYGLLHVSFPIESNSQKESYKVDFRTNLRGKSVISFPFFSRVKGTVIRCQREKITKVCAKLQANSASKGWKMV